MGTDYKFVKANNKKKELRTRERGRKTSCAVYRTNEPKKKKGKRQKKKEAAASLFLAQETLTARR